MTQLQTVESPPTLVETKPTSRIKSDPKLWAESGTLVDMLSYRRPDGSKTERQFIAKYLFPLGVTFDKYGNIYKQVGDDPVVLWSSHTDTVHSDKGFQKICYWHHENNGDVHFEVDHEATAKKSSCLGADDTCGIWLMIEMIKAQVPGLYIFHRAEEVGRKGSRWIADKNSSALNGIRFAIAFDRKGEKSIITHQTSKMCCSDEFAKSLSDQLGMGHVCDTTGSYTDTASYVDLVAECTNVSVGYENAHGSSEFTNVDYLFRLRDALLKIDVSKLVEKRRPGENTRLVSSYSYSGGHFSGDWDGYGYQGSVWPSEKEMADAREKGGITGMEARKLFKGNNWTDYFDFDKYFGLWFPRKRASDLGVVKVFQGKKDVRPEITGKPTYLEVLRIIRTNPEVIADLLETVGYGPKELMDHMIDVGSCGQTIHL